MDAVARVPEAVYYGRHFRLPGFTEATQDRLRQARVLVVGVGGLGCPAALYLAGAGVGTLALCDADTVSATNLHRQVLFDVSHLGARKVDVAAARLRAQNPHIQVEPIGRFADEDFLREHAGRYDLVLDGTDNFAAKFAINDACEAAGVPLVYGSIFQFEGQVSVFHQRAADGSPGWSYRDLFPEPPPAGLAQNCGEAGVIGVLPGIVGGLQAAEAIKLITGLGETLSGRLLTFDALTGAMQNLSIARRSRGPVVPGAGADEIGHDELQALMAGGQAPTLLDVRGADERLQRSIGGLHIPLADLPAQLDRIPRDRTVVVVCAVGLRSARAALYLQSALPGVRVLSLRGGLDGAACAV